MTKEARISLGLTLSITLCGVASSYGFCKAQIDHNTAAIQKVEETTEKGLSQIQEETNRRFEQQDKRIAEQSVILQSINNNLASMNTKMDLIMEGKLKLAGVSK